MASVVSLGGRLWVQYVDRRGRRVLRAAPASATRASAHTLALTLEQHEREGRHAEASAWNGLVARRGSRGRW